MSHYAVRDLIRLAARPAICLALCALFLSACGSYRGVAEFEVYRDAYSTTAETGESILDRLAVAERDLYNITNPFVPQDDPDFVPDEATYITDVTDPPATASFRRALRAVKAYNDALSGLASGDTAEVMAGRITKLSALGASAAADAAALVAPGAGPGTGLATSVAVASTVNGSVAALEPLTATGLGVWTRSAFRRRLIAESDSIRAIFDTVRDQTPTIYSALVEPISNRANMAGEELNSEDIDRILTTRELMANWVVLLDGSRAAFEVALAAVREDGGAGSFTGVMLAAEDLGNAARASRRNLAGVVQTPTSSEAP